MHNIINIFLISCIAVVLSQSENDTLIVYGQPYFADDGFVVLTANGGWQAAASGFAIQSGGANLIAGLAVTSSFGILFGSFSVWQGNYAGGLLRLGVSQIEVSTEGKGVNGNSIDDALILASSSQIVMIGAFYAFSQNPSQTVNSVGICDSNGSNCYQLGSTGLASYVGNGQLLHIGDYVFAFYETSSSCQISYYYVESDDPSLSWTSFFAQLKSLTQNTCTSFKIVNYQNTLHLIGPIFSTMAGNKTWESTTGIASYNVSTATWTARGPLPANSDSIAYFDAEASDSNIFLVLPTTPFDVVYMWNPNLGSEWSIFSNTTCSLLGSPIVRTVDDTSVVIKCNQTAVTLTNRSQEPLALSCPMWLTDFEFLTDNNTLISVCGVNNTVVRVDRFDIDANLVESSDLVTDLGAIQVSVYAMCAFGSRLFVSGIFDTVDTISTQNAATYDGSRWWPMQLTPTTRCACTSWDFSVAIGCSNDASNNTNFLLMLGEDNGKVSSASKLYTTHTAPYGSVDSVTALATSPDHSIIYIAGNNNASQLLLFQWDAISGFNSIVNFTGLNVQAIVAYNNILYIGGQFTFAQYSNFALYDLVNLTFLNADPVKNSKTNTLSAVLALALVDEVLYVGGSFDSAGSLTTNVQNVAASALNGTFTGNMQGGQTPPVLVMSAVGQKVYMVISSLTCAQRYNSECGALIFYDIAATKFGNNIRKGAGMIAPAGEKKSASSDSSNSSVLAAWWMILILSILGSIILMGIISGVYVMYRRKKQALIRNQYQEIQEHATRTDMPHMSENGIDFQNEEFELKNVLGRGSFGTVWSCVFPNRNGASYAVKQMLISRGDVQSIEMVENEIVTLAKLRHEHIVHFVGYKKTEQKTSVEFFIFMELFEKPCSLRGVIDKRIKRATKSATGRLDWFSYADVKKFMCEIADGLNYLHSNSIAHRDLKCANILVRTKTPTVVRSLHITDFGISTTAGRGQTLASTITGTPAFMAPEVARGGKYDAFKADIWSFGIVLFEILTFKEPEIPGERPTFLPERDLSRDKQFESIVSIMMLCTEEDPEKRPSASELFQMSEVL